MTAGTVIVRTKTASSPLNVVAAAVIAILALAVYLIGMGDTTPFWDAGEFIATSWILGVPHPPGTPLYVLLGRAACLVPFGTVAGRVNGLSAVASAFAVFFTVLATIRLLGPMWSDEKQARLYSVVGGVVAGLFLAFSNTFWINAIEAEVYGLSSMVMAIALWATLVWRDAAERDESAGDGRSLLLVFYLLSLSIGIHLGTYLILPGLIVLVALERRHEIGTADRLIWGVAYPIGGLVLGHLAGRLLEGGLLDYMFALAFLGLLLGLIQRRGFIIALFLLFFLGVSVHFFLMIRANLDPAINEAAPKNWQALWDVLTRKQYPPTNIFERRGPLLFQIDRLYLHYLREQFELMRDSATLGRVLPLALGMLGAIAHLMRRPRDGVMMLSHFLVMSLLLIIYLNLSGTYNEATGQWERGEVRERDYFFVPSFQIFAIWIGIGVSALLSELGRGKSTRRLVPVAVALAMVISLMPLRAGFAAHDRRRNYVARDYGYNILNFVEPNAIIFTNGDNDTFPLWYLQEVEGLRKDVRVVCLSLLNTGWYLKQLRDHPPQVPIAWTDEEIEKLRVALHPRDGIVTLLPDGRSYEPGSVKDVAVRHIVRENAFRRPVYFAVTVPDRVGFDRQLSFEGMVFRVLPQPPSAPMDFERAYANAHENYLYRGLFNSDGSRVTDVVLDETGEYLIHNYVILFAELAMELDRRDRKEEAIALVKRCEAIDPGRSDFTILRAAMLCDVGRSVEAESIFRSVLVAEQDNLDAEYRLGVALLRQGRLDEAKMSLERAVRLAGGQFYEPTVWLARVQWDRGYPSEARRIIADWVAEHPNDARAGRLLAELSEGDDSGLPR